MSYLKDEIPFCHSTFRSELRSCTHWDIFVLDAAFTAMPRTEQRDLELRMSWKENRLANKSLISRIKIVMTFQNPLNCHVVKNNAASVSVELEARNVVF